MPFKNYWSARLLNPRPFTRIRQQKDRFGKGINVVWKRWKGKTQIQAIRFSKDRFSKPAAHEWLKDHDFKYLSLTGESPMKTKKRKVSKKVLDALRRGREKLFAKRKRKSTSGRRRSKSRRIPERLEPIIITKGVMGMEGKRKRKKAKRRYHGGGEVFEARKKTHRRRRYHGGELMGRRKRRYHRYHGEPGGKGIMKNVMNAGMIAAGGIGGAFAAKFVPIQNAKIKAAVPLILGLGLGMLKFSRKPAIASLATGAAAVGILSLVKAFVPTIPTLAGDEYNGDDFLPTSGEEAAMLGIPYAGDEYTGDEYGDDYSGDDIQGEVEALQAEGYRSPADIG